MAKKEKEKIILENIELQPQVIGYTYKKKSNILRVIIIFVIFSLCIFYINDISVFINDLLGKTTASSIKNNAGNNNKEENKNNAVNKIEYHIFSNTLEIKEENFILKNFNYSNNKLTLEVENNSNSIVDLRNKKYYIELYDEYKKLLERHKINIDVISSKESVAYDFILTNNFYYFVLEEKTIDDYPAVNLNKDSNGISQLICIKDYEKIEYTFKNEELNKIRHMINENDNSAENYYVRYNNFQNKITKLNLVNGVRASFNGSLNSYAATIEIDLQTANIYELDEKYYYSYKEIPKVVKFEMETQGFACD